MSQGLETTARIKSGKQNLSGTLLSFLANSFHEEVAGKGYPKHPHPSHPSRKGVLAWTLEGHQRLQRILFIDFISEFNSACTPVACVSWPYGSKEISLAAELHLCKKEELSFAR